MQSLPLVSALILSFVSLPAWSELDGSPFPKALRIDPEGYTDQNQIMTGPFLLETTRNESTGTSIKVFAKGKTYWINQTHLTPVSFNPSFQVRAEPDAKSRSLGKLAAAELVDDVLITGKLREVEVDGAMQKWNEVIYLGHHGWVRDSAFSEAPAAPTAKPVTNRRKGANLPNDVDEDGSPESIASGGPACASSRAEAQANPIFRKLLQRTNPFTTWYCASAHASVTISDGGAAMLHHPLAGDLPLSVSICMVTPDSAYVSINGSGFHGQPTLSGPGFNTITIQDPKSGTPYTFVSQ